MYERKDALKKLRKLPQRQVMTPFHVLMVQNCNLAIKLFELIKIKS